MKDTKCVKLEDGLEYAVIDEITKNDIIYVYLVNVEDEYDFCIRKVDNSKKKNILIGLDNDAEFDEAMNLFSKKH